MKRIVIIGSGGAGKSTLAQKLGSILNIEVIHLDSVYWRSGWNETPRNEWIQIHDNIISNKDSWIIDGNYGSTMDTRISHADTIVFLDLPRIICLFRIIKRRIQYLGRIRPDMAEGCPEKIDKEFIKWVWNFPFNNRPSIVKKLTVVSNQKQIIHLKSRKAVSKFLKDVYMNTR